ncbi:uncharacterized protein TNCV_3389361 [Trichonephila clavipes]|nr:uncharacterized protein TNCV_3389361 [Trichonephila clavipes]
MLQQTFNGEALGKIPGLRMIFSFKSGMMSVEDMPHSGCPSIRRNDETIAQIKCVIDDNRRKTFDQIPKETNVSWINARQCSSPHSFDGSTVFDKTTTVCICPIRSTHLIWLHRTFFCFSFPWMKRNLKGK